MTYEQQHELIKLKILLTTSMKELEDLNRQLQALEDSAMHSQDTFAY